MSQNCINYEAVHTRILQYENEIRIKSMLMVYNPEEIYTNIL